MTVRPAKPEDAAAIGKIYCEFTAIPGKPPTRGLCPRIIWIP